MSSQKAGPMSAYEDWLVLLLKSFAAAQCAVVVLNLFLIRLLGWQDELTRLSLLPRQVFRVHIGFITLTLLIFGVLTWRFAVPMAAGSNPLATWLAGGIGLFWGVRTVMQVAYYSSEHWRGKRPQTVAHIVLLLLYGSMSATYLWAVITVAWAQAA